MFDYCNMMRGNAMTGENLEILPNVQLERFPGLFLGDIKICNINLEVFFICTC